MRRHLGFRVSEVKAMPWWERRLYAEGLNREASGEDAPEQENEMDEAALFALHSTDVVG